MRGRLSPMAYVRRAMAYGDGDGGGDGDGDGDGGGDKDVGDETMAMRCQRWTRGGGDSGGDGDGSGDGGGDGDTTAIPTRDHLRESITQEHPSPATLLNYWRQNAERINQTIERESKNANRPKPAATVNHIKINRNINSCKSSRQAKTTSSDRAIL